MKYKREHFNIPNHAHELTFSCYKNRKFLLDNNYCSLLVESIKSAKNKHNICLLAYVFMPTHVHLLICPKEEKYSISDILLSIKQSSSRKIMNYIRKNCPERLKYHDTGLKSKPYRFWQDGGGYDRNIISKEAIKNSIDYIHNNPIKGGLVESLSDWKWSSFNDWNNFGKGVIEIDKEEFLLYGITPKQV